VFYLALGIVFYSVYLFQIKFYYARMTLRRLGIILTFMLLLKILLSLVLVQPMQQNGLALATAITWLCGAIIMTRDLGKTLRVSISSLLSSDGYKIALSVVITLAFLWGLGRIWPGEPGETLFPLLGRMAAIVTAGGAVYCAVAYFLRLEEMGQLWRSLFGRGKAQNSAIPE